MAQREGFVINSNCRRLCKHTARGFIIPVSFANYVKMILRLLQFVIDWLTGGETIIRYHPPIITTAAASSHHHYRISEMETITLNIGFRIIVKTKVLLCQSLSSLRRTTTIHYQPGLVLNDFICSWLGKGSDFIPTRDERRDQNP